jgi:hypothetical protein
VMEIYLARRRRRAVQRETLLRDLPYGPHDCCWALLGAGSYRASTCCPRFRPLHSR